jgi:hypothetical protein
MMWCMVDQGSSALRARIGRVGVWLGPIAGAPASVEQDAVARLEALGDGAVWLAEGR